MRGNVEHPKLSFEFFDRWVEMWPIEFKGWVEDYYHGYSDPWWQAYCSAARAVDVSGTPARAFEHWWRNYQREVYGG